MTDLSNLESRIARRRAHQKAYYARLMADPERAARWRAQMLASYHRRKGGAADREKRDRYNAKRRRGPAKGNYGPRSFVLTPEVRERRVAQKVFIPTVSYEPSFAGGSL